ncbi:Uptake hydrogenase [Rhodospirillaceae bacterium LM-1]|nr:Uptake hydrogenase [Rhodospirillaceae bacterium LM-1]
MPHKAPYSFLWLQAASCGGCSAAALGSDPSFLDGGTPRLNPLAHQAVSEECGAEFTQILNAVLDGGLVLDGLLVEGAVLNGPNGTGQFQMAPGMGRPMNRLIADLAEKARHVVAVGSCAAFGGVVAGLGSRTQAVGLQYDGGEAGGLLGAGWRSKSGLPVVNVAGCAPHPGWIVETLLLLADGALAPNDLDSFQRPSFFADHLAHHGCNRNEYYEYKASAHDPSQQGCLMENLGCRATQAPGDCNRRRWNGAGSCTNAGYACIACTVPGFASSADPFLETPKLAGIPVGLPVDMPKAWFVALAALSKSATPSRVRRNATESRIAVPPDSRSRKPK